MGREEKLETVTVKKGDHEPGLVKDFRASKKKKRRPSKIRLSEPGVRVGYKSKPSVSGNRSQPEWPIGGGKTKTVFPP